MRYEIVIAHKVIVEADSLSEAAQMVDRQELVIDKSDRAMLSVVEIGGTNGKY